MFIDINTIGAEGLAFERSLTLRGLEGPSRERLPEVQARLEGRIERSGDGADLTARLDATVPLTCSRCLETFPWTVRTGFDWAVVRRAPDPATPRDDEPAAEDSVLVAPEGKIGLEDLATEQLYLNLPLKPICSPSCKGLCPACGANRNLSACGCETDEVDARLAPLLQFRRKPQP
ncbi:MAG TPA: DUF177 domain-containing protein [Candidatus Polarisedimenticolaceae bacterium]|nr:DUF177 domain-containing protein [Candidatus Polarisedimenticolaceae bacterium]